MMEEQMDKDLEKERQSAIDAVMRHLVPAYQICKSKDLIDRLTLKLGMVLGEFLKENEVDLFPKEKPEDAGFTCPRCGMTSHNPTDKREGYCGNCHDWTGVAVPWRPA
jgi:ribosomal protein S27AE